jgi:hypothetical protein
MPRGRPPNVERHRQIVRLRAAGLTYQEIGQRLGVTRQYVHQILKAPIAPIRAASKRWSGRCVMYLSRRAGRIGYGVESDCWVKGSGE